MTEHIDIDGKKFVKATLAADRVGYTPDYVTRLARSNKIDAHQSGRVWYVDPESLKRFALEAEAEKRQRSEELRQERLRERGTLLRELHEANIRGQISVGRTSALAQTTILAASFFVFLNLAWISLESELNVKNISSGVSALIEDIGSVIAEPLVDVANQFASFAFVMQPDTSVQQSQSGSSEVVSNGASSAEPEFQGIVLLEDADATTAAIDSVRNSFSDEVNVQFDGSETGVVTPVFRKRDGESYRFLLVPVEQKDS